MAADTVAAPFWEQEGRNPLIPAFLMVAIIGGLYAFTGSIVANLWVLIDLAIHYADNGSLSFPQANGYLEQMTAVYRHYQVPMLVLTVVFQFLFFFLLTKKLFRSWHGLPVESYFRITRASPLALLVSLAGIVVLIPLSLASADLFSRAFPVLKSFESLGNVMVEAQSPGALLFVFCAVALTPALFEEFLFRGYFHRTLQRKLSAPRSYLVSGIVFALIHQNYFGLVALVLAGVWLGFVYEQFGSLSCSAIAHFFYNSTLILIVNFPLAFSWLTDSEGFVKLEWVLLSVGLCFTAIFAVFRLSAMKSGNGKSHY